MTDHITRRQLAAAVSEHLEVDPRDIVGLDIDRHRAMQTTTPVVALSPEQARGFLAAIGIDATNVIWLSADKHEVRYMTETWDGPEPVHSHTVIEIEESDR